MLPKSDYDYIEPDFTVSTQPSLTYRLDIDKKRFGGKVDGIEAVKQAVYKILSTERYRYVIYSWKYGVELENLIGKPVSYVASEIPGRIKDALIQDDRIEDVTDFKIERGKNTVTGLKNVLRVTFMVTSVFGTFEASKEVSY